MKVSGSHSGHVVRRPFSSHLEAPLVLQRRSSGSCFQTFAQVEMDHRSVLLWLAGVLQVE